MEAVIRNAAALYQRTSETGISGRDTECAAFNMVNRELEGCTTGLSRVRAFGRNHSLWSVLLKDLALEENRLPDALKAQLIGLALWSMRYSTMAIMQNLSPEPLLDVNRNVMEGLLAQANNGGAPVMQHRTVSLDTALSI